MATRISTQYAAGFFDGEGSVSIGYIRRPAPHWGFWRVDVCVGQMNPAPLRALAARWGGSVSGPRKNGQFEWRLSTAAAERFLRDIEPHLIVKAEAVSIALEFRTGMRRYGCKGIPATEKARREHLRERLRAVNASKRWVG